MLFCEGHAGFAIHSWSPSSGQRDTRRDRPKEREKASGVREGSDLSGSGDLTYEGTVFDRYRIYTSPRSFLRCFLCRWIFYWLEKRTHGSIGCGDVPALAGHYRGKDQNSHFRCFSFHSGTRSRSEARRNGIKFTMRISPID